MMFFTALAFLLVAVFFLLFANRRQKSAGLPGGKVVYSDMKEWGSVDKPLFDPILGLTGKPDYIVRQGNQMIPVEVKSSNVSGSPYDSHIFQLTAYCYLIEQETRTRPKYGLLHYPTKTFRIDYTPELESAFLDLISEMRYQERRSIVNRSHESQRRCVSCGYLDTCNQSLI